MSSRQPIQQEATLAEKERAKKTKERMLARARQQRLAKQKDERERKWANERKLGQRLIDKFITVVKAEAPAGLATSEADCPPAQRDPQ
jgi:hypothetical protein